LKDTLKVGFSQRVRLEWLEQTAELALAGHSRSEIQASLHTLLENQLSVGSTATWGSRGKTVSLLLNIWGPNKDKLAGLRQDGLALLKRLPTSEHLPLHWGMTMAVYPFFGAVAEAVGRLMKLQDLVNASQVQRRIREQLGERETVERATRRVLRCFTDWGVLQDTEEVGMYQAAPTRDITNAQLNAWLIEAILYSNGSNSVLLDALTETPTLFPFSLANLNPSQLDSNHRLEIFQQSVDQRVILLRPNSVEISLEFA
jgi:hypothetical protein